jgi:hypothetical protein
MKKVLLLMVAVLMVSSVAMADHIGLYNDNAGTSCLLAPGGHFAGTDCYVIHKFTTGATGSRWKINFPAGSTIFAFSPASGMSPLGVVTSDMSVGYGGCQTGTLVLGACVGNLNPGTGAVVAADLQTDVVYTDCDFVQKPASGGTFTVAASGPAPCGEVATEPTTWGQVKALYR